MIRWLFALYLLRKELRGLTFSQRDRFWQHLRVYVPGSATQWYALPHAIVLITPEHVRLALSIAVNERDPVRPLQLSTGPTSPMGGMVAEPKPAPLEPCSENHCAAKDPRLCALMGCINAPDQIGGGGPTVH